MLKKFLASIILSTVTATAIATPGQPPAKKWTILSIASFGNNSVVSTYGTYNTQSQCIAAMKSIIAKNPYITESNGLPLPEYDMGVTVSCVPGTGGSVMQTTQ